MHQTGYDEAELVYLSFDTEQTVGGERGIRTLDTRLSPYNALAGRPLRPLGHLSEVRGILHALGDEQAADCLQLPAPLGIEPRILQVQAAQRVDDDLRNDQPRIRLVVRRH